jgi:hypothetical protein
LSAGSARGAYRARLVAVAGCVVLVGLEAVELLEGGDDVGNVEKAVAFETEVNERRLHAGQHFGYPALVKVAHHPTRPLALDEYFGNLVLLEDRDPCFVGARGDDHLLGHARCSVAGPAGANTGTDTASMSRPDRIRTVTSSRRPINVEAALQARLTPQLVKRRIRTLRIKPNPAKVAIMEEPP